MAGSFSTVTDNSILNLYLNGATLTNTTPLFVALYTVAPTAAGGGTEATGGSYARKSVNAGAGGDFNAASAGVAMPPAEKFGTGSLPCSATHFTRSSGAPSSLARAISSSSRNVVSWRISLE